MIEKPINALIFQMIVKSHETVPPAADLFPRLVRINAIITGICKYLTTLVPPVSSIFSGSRLDITGIMFPRTDLSLPHLCFRPIPVVWPKY